MSKMFHQKFVAKFWHVFMQNDYAMNMRHLN